MPSKPNKKTPLIERKKSATTQKDNRVIEVTICRMDPITPERAKEMAELFRVAYKQFAEKE